MMSNGARKFIAYTKAGHALAVHGTNLLKALREAESAKAAGDQIMAVIDASCVPAPAAGNSAVPFFALLLRNTHYTPPESEG